MVGRIIEEANYTPELVHLKKLLLAEDIRASSLLHALTIALTKHPTLQIERKVFTIEVYSGIGSSLETEQNIEFVAY
jgi:hypothetical protein